jgi:L-rhamnose isomerase/sugar isomerase
VTCGLFRARLLQRAVFVDQAVRPLLADLREEMGLARDPYAAYLRSGYGEKISSERTGGTPAGWGA